MTSIYKAERIGEQTKIAINKLLGAKAFIEQTYDGCLGVLRLADNMVMIGLKLPADVQIQAVE